MLEVGETDGRRQDEIFCGNPSDSHVIHMLKKTKNMHSYQVIIKKDGGNCLQSCVTHLCKSAVVLFVPVVEVILATVVKKAHKNKAGGCTELDVFPVLIILIMIVI